MPLRYTTLDVFTDRPFGGLRIGYDIPLRLHTAPLRLRPHEAAYIFRNLERLSRLSVGESAATRESRRGSVALSGADLLVRWLAVIR